MEEAHYNLLYMVCVLLLLFVAHGYLQEDLARKHGLVIQSFVIRHESMHDATDRLYGLDSNITYFRDNRSGFIVGGLTASRGGLSGEENRDLLFLHGLNELTYNLHPVYDQVYSALSYVTTLVFVVLGFVVLIRGVR